VRGSIIRRGKSYSVVVDLGRDPETGRRRQKWHSGYRTKREAEVALADLVGSVNRGTYVAPSKQSFAEFAGDWLEAIKPTLRDSTHYSYTRNLRLHVIPHLGALNMTAVDAGVLNGLYARLLASGNKTNRPGAAPGLSPRTVRYIHTIVHRMFKDAVRWGRLVRNPADAADPPRAAAAGSPEIVTWSAEQLGAFLDGMREHRLYAVFLLLATTGMRRGEALGLRWSDLDLANGRLAGAPDRHRGASQGRVRDAEDGERAADRDA
jgi:integrase